MKKFMMIIMLLCMFIAPMSVSAASAEPKEDKPQMAFFYPYYNGFSVYVYLDEYDNFEIYRATSKDGKYSKMNYYTVENRPSEMYVEANGLTTGKTYYFKIRNYKTNSKGKKVYSEWTKFTYTPQLSTPLINISPASSSKKYTVWWTQVNGATGYTLYRSKDDGAWKKVVSTKKREYNVSTKHDYTYRVRAYRKVGDKNVYSPWNYADATWKYIGSFEME